MKTFQELGICDEILKAITKLGYENPMPVQEQVIPHLLNEETDLVALAQTGTGKTAAFGLPVIQRIDLSLCKPQALILSPTRELCLQIASDLTDYSQYVSGLRILPVYGGSSIESQIKTLKKGVHIIVATPGRLVDLIERRTVQLDHVSTVIMDEADEMLNMGFLDSINAILSKVPQERKMLLFSATMPKEIEQIARTYMHEPKEVVVGSRNEGAENVRHVYYMVHAKDKYPALKRIADYYPSIYGIIFCRTPSGNTRNRRPAYRRRIQCRLPPRRVVTNPEGCGHAKIQIEKPAIARRHRRCRPRTRRYRLDPRHQLRIARRHRDLYTPQRTYRQSREIGCFGRHRAQP